MTTWIHDNEPNHLPPYAGHYIGVGGFVVNERDELLVVQERFSPLGIKHWKLPGGHKDPGEYGNVHVTRGQNNGLSEVILTHFNIII